MPATATRPRVPASFVKLIRQIGSRLVMLQKTVVGGNKAFLVSNSGKLRANSPKVSAATISKMMDNGFLTSVRIADGELGARYFQLSATAQETRSMRTKGIH